MGLRVCPVKAFIAPSRTHSRGATVTAPRDAIYGLKGQWEVENHSVALDIEVMMDPKAVREGHDPQLEKAVGTVMEMLKQHPLPEYPKPAYPNYHPVVPPLPCGEAHRRRWASLVHFKCQVSSGGKTVLTSYA